MSRAQLWGDLPPERHLALVDDALDVSDARTERLAESIHALEAKLMSEMRNGFLECKEDSKGQRRLLTGLLMSVVASCIIILVSLMATGAGP